VQEFCLLFFFLCASYCPPVGGGLACGQRPFAAQANWIRLSAEASQVSIFTPKKRVFSSPTPATRLYFSLFSSQCLVILLLFDQSFNALSEPFVALLTALSLGGGMG
jgi:hypothetical protein